MWSYCCKFSKQWKKSEFLELVKHCFLIGKNTLQAKQWLDKCYSDTVLSETTVKKWYADFKCGHTDKNDAECSGCLNLVVVLENTKKFHKLVLADCKLKLCMIAGKLKISEGNVFTILHEHLSMRKLCLKWVRRLLTVYVTWNMDSPLHSGVKSAVSWINSSRWKPFKVTKDANISRQDFGLHIAQGILSIDYPEKGRNINSEYYTVLLVRLKEEIAKKRPQRKKFSFTKHCHKSITTMAKLYELHLKLLPHPLYSLDLAPSNYWLFADLKRMLQEKRFGSNEEVISNWGKRQKGHWIVWEILESVSP